MKESPLEWLLAAVAIPVGLFLLTDLESEKTRRKPLNAGIRALEYGHECV